MSAQLGNSPLLDWFKEAGAYVMVDGQFGSTGKGLIAAVIAESVPNKPTIITTNAAPNSGHTAFFNEAGSEFDGMEIMTQQIPVASVWYNLHNIGKSSLREGEIPHTYLNGGAIIDNDTLMKEIEKYKFTGSDLTVHPCAAVITLNDILDDRATMNAIAGTGKGVGVALSKKVLRNGEQTVIKDIDSCDEYRTQTLQYNLSTDKIFVETAQGFSLGINEARFYPHTTSRECSVGQALADARIPAQILKKVLVTMRTYPIRVGNTEGSSGGKYYDQKELSWEELGLEPELTTITKRIRRVFSWSWTQFDECVMTNMPNIIFLNFCNYLPFHETKDLVEAIKTRYKHLLGKEIDDIILGFGKNNSDVVSALHSDWSGFYTKSLDGVPF